MDDTNPYDRKYVRLIQNGALTDVAIDLVVTAYLDGNPRAQGARTVRQAERDSHFWEGGFLRGIPIALWGSDNLILALSRYFGQEHVSNFTLLQRIAGVIPDAVCRAVRYSGLVLCQRSSRRSELDQMALSSPEIAELCRVLDIFGSAHEERQQAVDSWKAKLSGLSPFELLIYASLYAFEHLVPASFGMSSSSQANASRTQEAWTAINDLLVWKLSTATEGSVPLTEAGIGRSLAEHLAPFLFPSPSGSQARHDMRATFAALIDAQLELNSFISQSADAFSYDDAIRFVRVGERLEIVEVDAEARARWRRDGQKLDLLHGYWFYRVLETFIGSDLASRKMGLPENPDANQLAYIRALRTQLRLSELYGIQGAVTTEQGGEINLFNALLSLELMAAFFSRDFLKTYAQYLDDHDHGHWALALGRLAFEGIRDNNQNRFPITWSDRQAKIRNITGWTASAEFPRGSADQAAAILDFWTSDWVELASNLRNRTPGLQPELFERPVLKLGNILLQLPWLVGMQNNSTAAINNLRRLGARRGEVGAESRRIEKHLGSLFESRGFKVILNWLPRMDDSANAGEVDLICARDGMLFVLEVKSSFLRRSTREAWLHSNATLRKAGRQVRRKREAVVRAVVHDPEFAALLGLEPATGPTSVYGLIVDTSIECDHQRFDGYLKVSLAEVLIALRDEVKLLSDPDDILSGLDSHSGFNPSLVKVQTLYPQGFTAARFIEVIETEAVWRQQDQ